MRQASFSNGGLAMVVLTATPMASSARFAGLAGSIRPGAPARAAAHVESRPHPRQSRAERPGLGQKGPEGHVQAATAPMRLMTTCKAPSNPQAATTLVPHAHSIPTSNVSCSWRLASAAARRDSSRLHRSCKRPAARSCSMCRRQAICSKGARRQGDVQTQVINMGSKRDTFALQ